MVFGETGGEVVASKGFEPESDGRTERKKAGAVKT